MSSNHSVFPLPVFLHVDAVMSTSVAFLLEPEQQHVLELAVRDYNSTVVTELFSAGAGTKDFQPVVDCQPFEALCHQPGPEVSLVLPLNSVFAGAAGFLSASSLGSLVFFLSLPDL